MHLDDVRKLREQIESAGSNEITLSVDVVKDLLNAEEDYANLIDRLGTGADDNEKRDREDHKNRMISEVKKSMASAEGEIDKGGFDRESWGRVCEMLKTVLFFSEQLRDK